MLHRERVKLPKYVYPPEEWRIVEKRFYPLLLEGSESIFALSNGYLGMRGNFEEGTPVFQNATLINGFYESWPIVYGEEAYGFAKTGQTIVNVTDCKIIRLYIDDEPFFLPTAHLLEFERALDMRNGTLDRNILWETPAGKRVSISSRRLVSFEHRHLAIIQYKIKLLNANAPIVISSEMHLPEYEQVIQADPRLAKGFKEQVLLPKTQQGHSSRIILAHQTKSSRMMLACGIDHSLESDCPIYDANTQYSDNQGKTVYSIHGLAGCSVTLTKFITYHTSRTAFADELCARAERTLDRAIHLGCWDILASQRRYLDGFWQRSDLQVVTTHKEPERNIEVQQGVRFNLFHVFQAAARAEGSGIPAKGLTGQAYEGHYFWDNEIYVFPFLTYTAPRIVKNLLRFRHSMLNKARKRAREVNQAGALFPWRTINGDEASAYYASGTAQYHINADISYAIMKYVQATGDQEFLMNEGAEMLVETARLWNDLGFYSENRKGKFCIHGVTGPDEYNTVVNNNAFTNLMARENLSYAAETVQMMQNEYPDRFAALTDKTQLEPREVEDWKKAASNMYIPYNPEMGIHPQDDAFTDKEVWDFENTPSQNYPLLLHYHPLVIYRYQVIKQADVVLALFLLNHEFSADEKKGNFDYYDPLTTGDSSLSVGIQSIIASEIGYSDKAFQYARYSVLMDLGDVAGNVRDGCHIASMGGAWMVFVYGFAGMRDNQGRISFDPKLPERIERIRFPLLIRHRKLEVDINRQTVTYTLLQGDELLISHRGEEIKLTKDLPTQKRPCPPVLS